MNEQEQRIAIAESLGAVCIDQDGTNKLWFRFNGRELPDTSLPDYSNDLNAMHEVERTIPQEKICDYVDTLAKIVDADTSEGWSGARDWFKMVNATAAQRSEAFLKTIGKWKE